MRILFAAPAYWPSSAFGGPISVMRELARGLVARGHAVDVVTSSLTDLESRPPRRGRVEQVDGARVHYLPTPLRYRWMGITPSVWRELDGLDRPDLVHVFGFRDFVGTISSAWARRRRVPYVFEGLGMVRPKLRKVALKRALDASLYRPVLRGAGLLLAASRVEAVEYSGAGAPASRIVVRPNGFPAPAPPAARPGPLRRRLGLDAATPLVLSVGRIARGKGLDLLVRALADLPEAHLAIVGPDDRHGVHAELVALRSALGLERRVQLLGPWPAAGAPPLELFADADVSALVSAHENFGMVAAEAAAVGTASLVSDRCGIAELVRDRAALVVPYELEPAREALRRLLGDDELRASLGRGGRELAGELSWAEVVSQQERIYERLA